MSSVLTSLRLRLESSWNGSSLRLTASQATASQSRTNSTVFPLMHYRKEREGIRRCIKGDGNGKATRTLGSCSTRSGYLALIFSELRLKTAKEPSLVRWT